VLGGVILVYAGRGTGRYTKSSCAGQVRPCSLRLVAEGCWAFRNRVAIKLIEMERVEVGYGIG
jgi:hypothetical protein